MASVAGHHERSPLEQSEIEQPELNEQSGQRGWRKVVFNFTPSWFTVNMGTGIVSVLLFQFPYNGAWLYWLSIVVFCLNLVLWFLAVAVSILRYTIWPENWTAMMRNPTQALFLGAVPMGFATLINFIVLVFNPMWGKWVAYTAWGMWMADALLALSLLYILFTVMKQEKASELNEFTAVQLFPVLAILVSSETGALVSTALDDPEHALFTIITSYVLWGLSMPCAFMVFVIYYQRLAMHKLPPREVIVSVFLPLGPPSMGGFTILELGKSAMEVFPKTKTIHPMSGVILYNVGVLGALILWGFALLWLFLAVATICHCKRFPFNMGWWGFTFPIGTFAISSNRLALEMPSRFFKVIGAIASVCDFLCWIIVSAGTIKYAISGRLFNVPRPIHAGQKDRELSESSFKSA